MDGTISLHDGGGTTQCQGLKNRGTAVQLPVNEPLSRLIQEPNDAFGPKLSDADKLSFDQIEEALVANGHLTEQARANDQEQYAYGFNPAFDAAIVDRALKNESIFTKLQEDPVFKAIVRDHVRPRVYERD